ALSGFHEVSWNHDSTIKGSFPLLLRNSIDYNYRLWNIARSVRRYLCGLAGLTAGRDSHPALKINLVFKYSIKTNLVKRLKKDIICLKNMQNPAKKIHKALIKNNKTIAVAESCTGGLLSKILTDNSGSSKYFLLGVAAYNNRVKIKTLGIPRRLIKKRGAVSKDVARKMAESIRRIAKADFGIGITGIAGPSGETPYKPVGTVFIAAANNKETICKKLLLRGNRSSVRKQAAFNSLELLKSFL
ncbi:MAG: CinA family protein, partial [Candidatus Omnitrophica bacterium]|nr:CinA family protein [Candidatus Omnitrophota bacterium]